MNTIQKFILKLRFKLMIFTLRFKKSKTEADDDKGFIYEDE